MTGANGDGRKNGKAKPKPPNRVPLFESDPQVRATILASVRAGRSHVKACEKAGVSPKSMSNWKRRQGAAYDAFRADLLRAQEEGIDSALVGILEAGKEDWRALAWWLARCFPDQFSEKRILEHRDDSRADKRREALSDPDLRADLDRAARRLGSVRESS